ncbi:hypothetical protein HPB47_001563 [Ixodes persulcatus]|uniref:Uncharacterized protein n=1 Tax=Ixodes persulcatus TaxID=34615 RepID=A0AC60PNN6_IXOPE|nr:hypothetical protein HPB47_001563 [Ixodes persulcatus]
MAAVRPVQNGISWKLPRDPPTTGIIGDSQVKYFHQFYYLQRERCPALIHQNRARIRDVHGLLDLMPCSVTTVVLHIGTNDIATCDTVIVLKLYQRLLDYIHRLRPAFTAVYATLEASRFNSFLHDLWDDGPRIFFIDHGLDFLSPNRYLAVDGVHPSFSGVALLAGHLQHVIRNICDPGARRGDPTLSYSTRRRFTDSRRWPPLARAGRVPPLPN